LKLVTTDH